MVAVILAWVRIALMMSVMIVIMMVVVFDGMINSPYDSHSDSRYE